MKRYHSIDFLKGICIILIIITHSSWTDIERLRYLFPFWIDMAVPLLMIISGFVYSKSFCKAGIETFGAAYRLNHILGKIIRYTIPFIIIFLFEELSFIAFGSDKREIGEILQSFVTGGTGPGSYYYPVMVQFIFYFPIIFCLIKKYDLKGVFLCAAMNAVYECIKSACTMSEPVYRLLIFRYTLLIAIGCYLALRQNVKNNVIALLGISLTGSVYIILYRYLGYTPLVTTLWTGTSYIASLYVVPLATFLLGNSKLKNRAFELLGRASYHIFLVQKIYYSGARILYQYIPYRPLQLIFNIAICILFGLLFFYLETPITRWCIKNIKVKSRTERTKENKRIDE